MKKGALVELVGGIGGGVPNVIIFQFNPETVRHTWSQGAGSMGTGMGMGTGAPGATGACGAPGTPGATGANPLAVTGAPSESFSFTLSMDVTDHVTSSDPAARLAAEGHGLYARLAALELLLHPKSMLDALTRSSSPSGSSSAPRNTPTAQLPIVLFVWGTSRIVPVRVVSLSITEKLYDADLNPTHADAQLELRVLTSDDLHSITGTAGDLAKAAYAYSLGTRIGLAASNLGSAARDVIGMLAEKRLM